MADDLDEEFGAGRPARGRSRSFLVEDDDEEPCYGMLYCVFVEI